MSFWLTTFIVSGSGIILLLVLKLVQEKMNILLFWPEMRHHVEVLLVHNKRKITKHTQFFSSQNMYIVLHFFVTKLKKMLVRMYKWLDKKSNRLISLIRGKQHIDSRGKSSYFLHDIASFKDRFRK